MFEEPLNVRKPATKHSLAVQLIVKMSLAHVSVSQSLKDCLWVVNEFQLLKFYTLSLLAGTPCTSDWHLIGQVVLLTEQDSIGYYARWIWCLK